MNSKFIIPFVIGLSVCSIGLYWVTREKITKNSSDGERNDQNSDNNSGNRSDSNNSNNINNSNNSNNEVKNNSNNNDSTTTSENKNNDNDNSINNSDNDNSINNSDNDNSINNNDNDNSINNDEFDNSKNKLDGEQSPIQLSTISVPSSTNKEPLMMMEKHTINSSVQIPKVEIEVIPPLKVHCSSLNECLETFKKEDPQNGRCYILYLGNSGLGDEGLTMLSDNFPGNLEIADLSWNDIGANGSDAFDNFCSMMRRSKSLIQSLCLMGNQLTPQMIEVLLESVEIGNLENHKTAQVKKGYKGFGLNLKETGIENEGAQYIAEYIGSNKTPGIIGLDLTSSGVTDVAMSQFTLSLSRAQFLTTLILDENYLGDDGAILLADGLATNKSLTHLQLRNTGIGEIGTTEICNACKFNMAITLLDISLNPWQLGGEIALESLSIYKQQFQMYTGASKVKIVWKDESMESSLEIEEILEVVQYFGTDKIVDVVLMGISFSPLIENEKLYKHLKLENKHIDKIFKRISSNIDIANYSLNSLQLLVALLPILRENESFLDNLSSLFLVLDRSIASKKIDFLLLGLLDFFNLLIKSDHHPINEKIDQNNLFAKCFELLFNFPSHSVLHCNILNLINGVTQSTYLNFYQDSTFTNELFIKLMAFVTQENEKSPGLRKANYAYSLEISSLLDSHSNSSFLKTDEWFQFKANILQKELQLQQSFLCGFIPDKNQKIDPEFLNKFERESKI